MTAQIELTEAESQTLVELARRTGKSEGALLREVISQFLIRSHREGRLQLLRQARGIWKDRRDLPDHARLRDEWDRS